MRKLLIKDREGNLFAEKSLPQTDVILTVGRHSESDIILHGNMVSRKHARLFSANGIWFVEDCGSTTGTLVNHEKISETTPFEDQDVIEIGGYVLSWSSGEHSDPPAKKTSQAAPHAPASEPGKGPESAVPKVNNFLDEFKNATLLYTEEAMKLKRAIHEDVLEKLNLSMDAVKEIATGEMVKKAERCLDQVLRERRHEVPRNVPIDEFRQALLDELIGFGPISPLLRSPKISEIMINGPNVVFVESSGKLFNSGVRFFNDQHLLSIIQRIVEPLGRHVDEASPMVDARLPDGSRVNAIIPPLAFRGASVTIRKFADKKLTTDDLIAFGSMTREMALFLEEAVKSRKNILVSGGTGSGKTTLLNVLSQFIPEGERVVTVEDSAELKLTHPNLVGLEARPANIEGKGKITIRDLVINTLRMRPDRIIVGECRGAEALDMLQAMNTGHDGSLTTAHANNPRDALSRLENMVMMAGFDLPSRAIREQIASAIDLIVQQTRLADGSRKITQITEVTGREQDVILLQDIFTFEQSGIDEQGKVIGRHNATGNIPMFIEELRRSGKLTLDMSVFVPKS